MRESKYIGAVVFDLDGTLLATLDDLADSTNYALVAMGYPQRTVDEVRRFVGNGVGKLIRRAVPSGTSEEDTERCLELFRDYYGEHMEDKTMPYPGIPELLRALRSEGIKVGVVSNKYDLAVKRLCGKYFPGLVDVAVGEREGVRRKPAPDSVLAALSSLGSAVGEAVYVGDSDVDMETAKKAGTVSIGVLWGFRDEENLRGAGADHIVSSPEELLRIVASEH